MSKQTAVEWLASQLGKHIIWEEKIIDIIEQTKEIERKQIQDAFYHGIAIDAYNVNDKWIEAEKYYEQTYGV
jgi:hypothetical protein